jgi:Caspase domain
MRSSPLVADLTDRHYVRGLCGSPGLGLTGRLSTMPRAATVCMSPALPNIRRIRLVQETVHSYWEMPVLRLLFLVLARQEGPTKKCAEMESTIEKFLNLLPTPILIAVGLVCLCAWLLKEARAGKGLGPVLKLRSFQVFCGIVFLPVAAYYGHATYSSLFPPAEFSRDERGIAVYLIERDIDGVVQSQLYETLQLTLAADPTPNGVKVRRRSDGPRDFDEARVSCRSIGAAVCVWGSLIPPKTVFLHAVLTESTSLSISAQIDDYSHPGDFALNVVKLASKPSSLDVTESIAGAPSRDQGRWMEEREQGILDRLASLEQTVSALVDSEKWNVGAETERQRRRIGLFIGVSDYERMPSLRFSAGDARAVAGAVDSLWPKTQLSVLLDREATRGSILSRMRSMRQEMTTDDQVWVYLSGHAVTLDSKTYFLPVDARPDQALVDGIPFSELRDWLMDLPAKQVIVLVDTCYSGSLLPRLKRGAAPRNDPYEYVGKGTVVFVATGPSQVSYEDARLGHGVFTNAVLEGLSGKASGVRGVITPEALFAYVRNRVSEYAVNGVEQTPMIYSTVDNGVIVLAQAKDGSTR